MMRANVIPLAAAQQEREDPTQKAWMAQMVQKARQLEAERQQDDALRQFERTRASSQSSSPTSSFSPNLQLAELIQGGPAQGLSPSPGAATSGGFPSSGSFGVGSGVGGAPGGAAASASGGGAGMSNLFGLTSGSGAGAFASPAVFAAMIGGGKMLENNLAQDDPDNPFSMAGMGLLGPSINQYREDPKLLGLSAIGAPFLTPFFANDDAKQADPEFAGLWRGFGLPFG